MTIANCPRCCERVSVPMHASHEATVQCPLCQEEYLLGEALAQLPPALVVLSDIGGTPPTELDEDEDSWSAISLNDDDVDEVAVAPTGESTGAAPFDFASGPTASGGKATSTIRPSTRARKPKGSPIKSVLSIVIGGLMAFPIAQGILWYLPGDLKRDFGAGPIVAQYVPAIVPAKFRGSKATGEASTKPSFQNANVAGSDFNFGDSDKFASPATDDRGNGNAAPANKNKKKQKAAGGFPAIDDTATDQPAEEEAMSLDDAAAAGADVFGGALEVPGLELGGVPTIDAPSPPSIKLSNEPIEPDDDPAVTLPPFVESPLTIEKPSVEVSGLAPGSIRNAPSVTADVVVKSFQSALSGNLAWDTDEASTPNASLKREFYQSFSMLGEALTFADRSDETVATQISETAKLLHEIGKQPDKLEVIAGVAKGWMGAGYEVRKTNGICLTGVVKTVEPIGEFYETTITNGGKQIAVVSTSDPSEYFVEGSQVLVLGTILDDPKKNFGGYEGSRDAIVLDGFHVNVATE